MRIELERRNIVKVKNPNFIKNVYRLTLTVRELSSLAAT